MSNLLPSPDNPQIKREQALDDPHYHDEDYEVQTEEQRRKQAAADARRRALRRTIPKHRPDE
jgi:hypothetical protein